MYAYAAGGGSDSAIATGAPLSRANGKAALESIMLRAGGGSFSSIAASECITAVS